jgi:hypothetical protein
VEIYANTPKSDKGASTNAQRKHFENFFKVRNDRVFGKVRGAE